MHRAQHRADRRREPDRISLLRHHHLPGVERMENINVNALTAYREDQMNIQEALTQCAESNKVITIIMGSLVVQSKIEDDGDYFVYFERIPFERTPFTMIVIPDKVELLRC